MSFRIAPGWDYAQTGKLVSPPGGDRPRKQVCRVLATAINYLPCVCWQLFAATCVRIQAASLQPPRHSSCLLLIIILGFSRLYDGTRLENLRCTELELNGCGDFPLPQIFLLARRQIFPEPCPNSLDWIQVHNATMMPQLLHLHMSVGTDSRRIRARFGSGFVRICGDSCGFALVFGGDEKTLIQ